MFDVFHCRVKMNELAFSLGLTALKAILNLKTFFKLIPSLYLLADKKISDDDE